MFLNYPVSKKAFKLALNKCWNLAWIIANEQNYNKALELSSTSIYFDIKNSGIELVENGFYNSSTFDLTDMYSEDNDSDDENLLLTLNFKEKLEQVYNVKTESIESGFIEDGNIVGAKAREFFAYINVKNNRLNKTSFTSVDLSPFSSFEEAKIETEKALSNPHVKYIFEPAFRNENSTLKTKCDILEIVDINKKEVIIYEVKASTKFKKEHFYDVVYQKLVLEEAGYIVRDINIVLLNPNFTLNKTFLEDKNTFKLLSPSYEDAIADLKKIDDYDFSFLKEEYDVNLEELFYITNYYDALVEKGSLLSWYDGLMTFFNNNEGIEKYLNKLGTFFNNDSFIDDCCKLSSRNKKFKISSDICGHINNLFDSDIPSFHSFIGMMKAKKKRLIKKYNTQYLEDSYSGLMTEKLGASDFFILKFWKKFWDNGFHKISDQINMKDELFIDEDRIEDFESVYNDYLNYPLYMYDFETVRFAIPKYNSVVPHTQVTYQYSLHIIKDDKYDYNNSETMEHHYFIAEGKEDPRIEFLKSFLKSMLKYPNGVYVAYYKSFEITRLKEMAAAFPDFKNALLYIANRTIDLMDFFKKKQNWLLIYQPKFYGSTSIKKTQPSLDGSISYKDLRVNNGMLASEIYRAYAEGRIDPNLWSEKIRNDMILYCNRDTLAMVVVLQRVRDIYEAYKNRSK